MIRTKMTEILEKLPMTASAELQYKDYAVGTFLNMLYNCDDPMPVIDEMFVYYTKIIEHQREEIKKMLPYYPPQPIEVNKPPST